MRLLALLPTLLFCLTICAQTYDTNSVNVSLFAGSGFSGLINGQGANTMFDTPWAIASDTLSNLFVLDQNTSAIRKVTPTGTVSTFTTIPAFGSAWNMIMDKTGLLWIPNRYYSYVTFVQPDSYVSTYALNNAAGNMGVCVDSKNNLYIADTSHNKILRWFRTNGVVEVFVGSGNQGTVDGNWIFNSWYSPAAMAVDSLDNIYVWDSGNHLIRMINQNRDVITLAGTYYPYYGGLPDYDGAGTNVNFRTVNNMCFDGSGNLILACDTSIRKISPTLEVTTLAGSFTQRGYTNGSGASARFDGASGVCCVGGSIFISETGNQRIRRITTGLPTSPNASASLTLATYPGLQISGILGRSYQVQASPDLTNWTDRATVNLSANPQFWVDQQPVSGTKFYRALLLP